MTKLFRPPPYLSRLEAVASTASRTIQKLESDLAWYKAALTEKSEWARSLVEELEHMRAQRNCWKIVTAVLIVLITIYCATSLASR